MLDGSDLQCLTRAACSGGFCRTRSSRASGTRAAGYFHFMANMVAQFRRVARQLIRRSVLIREREVAIGAAETAFNGHLTAGTRGLPSTTRGARLSC